MSWGFLQKKVVDISTEMLGARRLKPKGKTIRMQPNAVNSEPKIMKSLESAMHFFSDA